MKALQTTGAGRGTYTTLVMLAGAALADILPMVDVPPSVYALIIAFAGAFLRRAIANTTQPVNVASIDWSDTPTADVEAHIQQILREGTVSRASQTPAKGRKPPHHTEGLEDITWEANDETGN